MLMSLNSSFTTYARSLEGTSLNKYSNLSKKSNKNENGSIEGVRADSDTISSKSENKVVTRDSEIFYNNYLLKTSSDKSYVIDGVEFSSEEVDAVRGVLQNAVSPLLGGKMYYDYKDYAEMGIAENSVAQYAAENLTEEQAEAVNKSLSDYIAGLLHKQEEWLNSECYIDDTKGVGDTGEMNTYYGVRHSIPHWMKDETDAALAKFNTGKQSSKSKAVSDNYSAEEKNGSLIYCASNKELAENIRALFAGTDIMDASQLADTFKKYKDMLKVAYKAVLSGINRNGVNYKL